MAIFLSLVHTLYSKRKVNCGTVCNLKVKVYIYSPDIPVYRFSRLYLNYLQILKLFYSLICLGRMQHQFCSCSHSHNTNTIYYILSVFTKLVKIAFERIWPHSIGDHRLLLQFRQFPGKSQNKQSSRQKPCLSMCQSNISNF